MALVRSFTFSVPSTLMEKRPFTEKIYISFHNKTLYFLKLKNVLKFFTMLTKVYWEDRKVFVIHVSMQQPKFSSEYLLLQTLVYTDKGCLVFTDCDASNELC